MPIDAPGPVIEVTRPTVISGALAGSAISEAIAAAPARRSKLLTRTSGLRRKANDHAVSSIGVFARHFKLETICRQWFCDVSTSAAAAKCPCGPDLDIPQIAAVLCG